jgi:hypothetical protein
MTNPCSRLKSSPLVDAPCKECGRFIAGKRHPIPPQALFGEKKKALESAGFFAVFDQFGDRYGDSRKYRRLDREGHQGLYRRLP